jgi:hypothetical protein
MLSVAKNSTCPYGQFSFFHVNVNTLRLDGGEEWIPGPQLIMARSQFSLNTVGQTLGMYVHAARQKYIKRESRHFRLASRRPKGTWTK